MLCFLLTCDLWDLPPVCSTEFEIFDEATSKKIQDEHEKDMADAAKAIGERVHYNRGLALMYFICSDKRHNTDDSRYTP